MQLLYDFFPILVFFVMYKLQGIYVATIAAILISLLQVIYDRFRKGRFERMQLITLGCIVFFGGATLLFHKPIFIQWKPTVLYWICALAFLFTQFFSTKTLIARMLESRIQLPARSWKTLNLSWVMFFAAMGGINLYVVYHFSESDWVNFKLFGTLGLTLLFLVLQSMALAKHLGNQPPSSQ